VLEDDDEGELEAQDLPVDGGVVAVSVAETAISKQKLIGSFEFDQSINSKPALGVIDVVVVRRVGQGVVDVAVHVPPLLVLEDQLGDELGREGDQNGLK